MNKKFFYTVLTICFGLVELPLFASSVGNKIKSAIKKVANVEKKAIKAEAKFFKNQAVGIKKNTVGAVVAFKKGNVKEGFKDIGKGAYNSLNLVTIGKVDQVKTASQNVYKGTKEVAKGNKKGWKDIGKGVGAGVLATTMVAGIATPVVNFSVHGMQKAHDDKNKNKKKR